MKKGRLNISELFDKISTLLFILPIRFYQIFISPLFPPTCRHIPTCSEYAVQAIKIHGIFYGTWLALKRLSRCHPWGTSGYDPVPPKRPKKRKSKK